jgi:hypothetical protein
MGSKERHYAYFIGFKWGDEVLIPIRGINIYVSNELSRAVPVYYDLKRVRIGNLILKL